MVFIEPWKNSKSKQK